MRFVNLTPHKIVLRPQEGEDIVVEPSGTIARVAMAPGARLSEVLGIPVYGRDERGGVEGLPAADGESVFIVSGMAGASAECRMRNDILVPGTGPEDGVIRNEKGWVIAVTRLKRP